MLVLGRTAIPFIESVDGEVFVGRNVKSRYEVLLLLVHTGKDGLSRTEVGKMAKCSTPSVITNLKALEGERLIHKSGAKQYFITAQGEAQLAVFLSEEKN